MNESTAVRIAYYYRVKWGHQEEFVELFKKNHLPVLRAQIETGRILGVEAFVPTFNGDGRADWTFMTAITFRDWAAVIERSQVPGIVARLYPDAETFRAEERHRFELLDAQWDMPLSQLDL